MGGMSGRSMDWIVSPAALLDAFVETSDDAMISHDVDGNVTTWNQTAERLFGYPAQEIIGEPYATLFPDHVRDDVRAVVEAVMAGDRVKHFETEILRKDGMPMPISMSLCPVFDDDVEPVALVLVARDITEQRLAQATLGEVEARIRESEAMAHVGSWLWDRRTGAVQWSDEFHRIHGVDPLDFDGTFGQPFEDVYRILRPDGEVRIVHARAQPTIGSAGTVLGLRGFGQDVTDRRVADSEIASRLRRSGTGR